MSDRKPVTIVVAEDDAEDRMLTAEAFEGGRLVNELQFVEDGQELLDYLRNEGQYANGSSAASAPPALILLDLNMPRMNGREALSQIKADPNLRRIPVIVLTTSIADEDIMRTYDLGVNSYIRKPVSFDGFRDAIRRLEEYWLELVQLPPE